MPILIRSQRGPHDIPVGPLRTRARRLLHAIGRTDGELSILLVDDSIIQSLNATYRGKDQPTDVLSFAMGEGEFGDLNPAVLGDVVISVPTARRQASRSRREPLDQVTFLLTHGLLHLVGYDHQTDEQEREMKRETKRLMREALDPRPITSRR
jgi:probable rRNA maturation factor